MSSTKRTLVTGAVTAVIALALFAASARAADDVASPADASADAVEAVVVHGFRKSLGEARALKKDSAIVADAIVAEDMAKFPDLNLAESLQRLPGVAINRGNTWAAFDFSVFGSFFLSVSPPVMRPLINEADPRLAGSEEKTDARDGSGEGDDRERRRGHADERAA